MDYERLPVILKRYSFIEKMRVLQYYRIVLQFFK